MELTPDQRQRLDSIEQRMAQAQASGDQQQMQAALAEGRELVIETGGVEVAQVQQVADLMESAVNVALDEIIHVADRLGVPVIPVDIIRELREQPKTAVQAMWQQLTEVQGLVKISVPDDLSGLEDL